MNDPRRCESCAFFARDANPETGECVKRHALVYDRNGKAVERYPAMQASDMCGLHMLKSEIPPTPETPE